LKMNSVSHTIVLDNVSKIYPMGEVEVKALNKVSLSISSGEFIAVIGKSGSGKSTLMNMIGCLSTPTEGQIIVKSKNIFEMDNSELADLRGRTIGFVFQQFNLMPGLTALENVMLPLEIQDVAENVAKEKAAYYLKMVGLSDKFENTPGQMSGGEQQRVSIARALVTDPDIILADEPTGALDSNTGREVLKILIKLWKEKKKTVIVITHDQQLAQYMQRHVILKDGEIISDELNKNQNKLEVKKNKKK